METAAYALLILVSTVLTILLVVLIVFIVLAIKLVKKVQILADDAEEAVRNVAAAGDALKKVSGPIAFAKVVTQLIKLYKKK
jgi:hypothetical protein